MFRNLNKIEAPDSLLLKFNSRESEAYSEVYTKLYKSLYYFAYSLYKESNVDCEDIIQDVFLEIWENKHVNFDSVTKIRSYIFVAIRNKFLMHCRHQKTVEKANEFQLKDDNFFIIHAAESEIYSIIPEALNLLPEDCVETFNLFIEGYSVKEIAQKKNKPLSTIYSQRDKSISILKRKLPREKFRIIVMIFLNS